MIGINAARARPCHGSGEPRRSAARGSSALDGTGRIAVGQMLVTDAASQARLTVGTIRSGHDRHQHREPARRGARRSSSASCAGSRDVARGHQRTSGSVRRQYSVGDGHRPRLRVHRCMWTKPAPDISPSPPDGSRLDLKRPRVARPGRRVVHRRDDAGQRRARRRCGSEMRRALDEFDDAARRGGSLCGAAVPSAHAGPGDAMTLWHLISRADAADRPQIVEALADLLPMPPGVTRRRDLAPRSHGARSVVERARPWRSELVAEFRASDVDLVIAVIWVSGSEIG